MLEIKFESVKLNIPTKWEDVSLKDYESWYLQKPETELEYIQYVADICKIDAKEFLKAPVDLFNIISEAVSFVSDQDFEPKSKIEISGKEYFINYADKLTLGEWVDVDEVLDKGENKISELLAILCRPIGEKYKPDNVEERKKLFQEQSCDKVLPLIGFFLLKEKKSRQILDHSLRVIAQGDQFLQDIKTSVINGDGIKQFAIWQRIRYTYLTKLLEKQLTRCSDFFSTGLINHRQKQHNINLKNK